MHLWLNLELVVFLMVQGIKEKYIKTLVNQLKPNNVTIFKKNEIILYFFETLYILKLIKGYL